MSQKLIIGIMGAIIIAGGGAWYYQTHMSDDTSNAVSTRDGAAREKKDEKEGGVIDSIKGGASSFADILSGGDAQQCTFSGTDPDTKEFIEGTIYVSGESFRADFNTVMEGKEIHMSMIQHEQVLYMWSDDENVMPGVKIDARMFEDLPEAEKPESPLDLLKDPESGMEYDCDGWIARSSSFEPPADVEFLDLFGEMGKMFGGMMGEGMMGESGTSEGGWDY